VQIDAPARDGEANAALVDFISSVISCFLPVLLLDLDQLAKPRCLLVVALLYCCEPDVDRTRELILSRILLVEY
jgi:hypothetical protein